jgi:Holliday junction resolvase RusA-like endonuclease
MIHFTVYGSPVAQGRPRFARIGNHVRAYDPGKSKSWKETVKWQAIENRVRLMEGPLHMILHFRLPRPKSLPKKVLHHTKKPDLDNLVKGVKDGLKGVCYLDDSQVIRLAATKEYGEQPGVEVRIVPADAPE